MEKLKKLRWGRMLIAFAICAVIYAAASYFYIQNQEICAVKYSGNGDQEVIFSGDLRCPK